jgi:hypothetical protein
MGTIGMMLVNPFLFGGGGGGGLPVAGALAWYKPETGLFTDAGTTPVASDGDLVYQWNDQSGNGYHLVQTTSGDRPIYRPGTTDDRGKKAVGFETKFMNWPDALATALLGSAKAAEIWLKFKNIQDGTHNSSPWALGVAGGQTILIPWGGDGLLYEMAFKNSRVDSVNAGKALNTSWNTYNVSCVDSSAPSAPGHGLYDMWMDGTNIKTIAGSVTFHVESSGLKFGQEGGSGAKMNSYVTEIVIFASRLSSGDRTLMNTYFGL